MIMLTQCLRCSGFVPDDCSLCPHCGLACSTAAKPATSGPARILRKVLRGTLIAGSSMVLAACYGCPPDECEDGLGGSGGFGGGSGGGTSTGGFFGSGGGQSTGGQSTGGHAGDDGLGGLGGLAGFGGGDAP